MPVTCVCGLLKGQLLGLVIPLVMQLLVLSSSLVEAEHRELCNVASDKCIRRVGCSMALHNYYIGCSDMISGTSNECTPRCKKALISLLSTEDKLGEAFMECDCDGAGLCEDHKSRLEVCSKDVLQAMRSVYDMNTDISCSLAEMICRADTSCLAALDYYLHHCGRMFRGEKCTNRCNNSLGILFRQAKAWKMRTCICDGTTDFPMEDCQAIQNNMERLCFLPHPRPTRHHRPNHTRAMSHHHTTTTSPNFFYNDETSSREELDSKPGDRDENIVNLASSSHLSHGSPLTLASLLLVLVTWWVHR